MFNEIPLSRVFISATFACFGGLFGKLSGHIFVEQSLTNLSIQLLCFVLMLIFNTVSYTLYVKALNESSSFKATVVNSSANFFLSSLFGALIFQETTGWLWWIGICFVLFGIILIQSANEKLKNN